MLTTPLGVAFADRDVEAFRLALRHISLRKRAKVLRKLVETLPPSPGVAAFWIELATHGRLGETATRECWQAAKTSGDIRRIRHGSVTLRIAAFGWHLSKGQVAVCGLHKQRRYIKTTQTVGGKVSEPSTYKRRVRDNVQIQPDWFARCVESRRRPGGIGGKVYDLAAMLGRGTAGFMEALEAFPFASNTRIWRLLFDAADALSGPIGSGVREARRDFHNGDWREGYHTVDAVERFNGDSAFAYRLERLPFEVGSDEWKRAVERLRKQAAIARERRRLSRKAAAAERRNEAKAVAKGKRLSGRGLPSSTVGCRVHKRRDCDTAKV